MDSSLYKIIIAAYLHDMGKLLWRGDFQRKTITYKVAHAQQVYDFFNDTSKGYSEFWKEIGLIASLHHAKDFFSYEQWESNQQNLARKVYMADNISSRERIDYDNLEEEKRYEHIKHFGLRTVFENLFAEKGKLISKFAYIPTTLQAVDFTLTDKGASLQDVQSGFEKGILEGIGGVQIKQGFNQLAEGFEKGLDILVKKYNFTGEEEETQYINLIYALDMLTQNYFSLVPSDAYTSIGDISLYDHTKTTVAIAVVLWKSKVLQHHYINAKTADICKERVSLIAGDFPSIQKYLFGHFKNNEEMSKRLRAKSLMVQLMNEAVIEFLLYKLKLPRANVLINAGGKFVILCESQEEEMVKYLVHTINRFLIKHYDGNVRFVLAEQKYRLADIFEIKQPQGKEGAQQVVNAFSSLFSLLSQQKHQTFDSDNLSLLFQSKEPNAKVICKYCGLHYTDKDDETSEEAICEYCKKEKSLGKTIVNQGKNGAVMVGRVEPGGKTIVNQGKKGVSLTFHDELEDFDFKVNEGVSQLFIQFNSWELPEHNEQLPVVPKSINLYVPKDEKGVTKDFSELASKNRKYLCMLKGDIDLMSIILKHGFETTYSVSRLVQFSRMLELFFGCYLNNFLKSKFENVYTVYSGGDDFVFIVPFVDRFTFISALYKKFGSFVAGNEKVHFSVGLSIFKDKTPFSAVEQQTEELLKAAKKKAKSVLEDIKEGEREKLECRGIVVYDKDFTFSFLTTEEITNLEKKSTLEWPMGEGGITDTMLYTMYETLSEMLQEFKKGNVAKYLHLGARVLYMLQKNLKEEYREIIINDIKSIISEIPLKNDEFYTEKLQNILYKIVNLMYANRA